VGFAVAGLWLGTLDWYAFSSSYSPHKGTETEERRKAFFAASKKAWEVGVVDVLTTLEHEMVGPFALGDHVVRPSPNWQAAKSIC
jgi:hypothetical protein